MWNQWESDQSPELWLTQKWPKDWAFETDVHPEKAFNLIMENLNFSSLGGPKWLSDLYINNGSFNKLVD